MATVERDKALGSNGAAAAHLDLPPGSDDDKRLTLAFQQGDPTAYQTIYNLYGPRVRAICVRMLGNGDAEEAEQETFLKVFQALGRFNGRYQLGPWIGRIATNVCLDQIRARHRKPSDPVPTELLELQPGPVESDDPAQILIRKSESRRVMRLLASLPPLHRAAIVLRDFEGFSYEAIAQSLDLTEFQVKALLHRARKKFRRSWLDGVAAILPWRLAQRFRPLDGTLREQTSSAITQVVHTSAPTCASVLQQCGQYVSDHVAGAVAAAIVGTAAVSGAVVAAKSDHVPPVHQVTIAADSRVDDTFGKQEPAKVKAKKLKNDDGPRQGAAPVPVATPTGPEPTPSSSPTDDPASTPTPTPYETSNGGEEEQPPTPTQQSVPVALGFDRGRPIPASSSSDHSTVADCDDRRFEQQVWAPMHDGDQEYAAGLYLQAKPSTGRLELTLVKDGDQYHYISSGQSAGPVWTVDEDSAVIEISGSYTAAFGSHPEEAGLPSSGSFRASITIDCENGFVTQESVTLSTQ